MNLVDVKYCLCSDFACDAARRHRRGRSFQAHQRGSNTALAVRSNFSTCRDVVHSAMFVLNSKHCGGNHVDLLENLFSSFHMAEQ